MAAQYPATESTGHVAQPAAQAVHAQPTVAAHHGVASTAAPVAPVAASEETHHVSRAMDYKEAKNLQKVLEKEQKNEDKNIKQQVKEIAKAEKAESKALKSDKEAEKDHHKAVEHEHELAKKLERLQAKHDNALREVQKTANEIEVKQSHHQKVTTNMQHAKAQLDDLTHAREVHQPERESKIKELEAIIADHKNSK